MPTFLDPASLLAALGTAGLFGVLVAETGLLVGFFLPGDSLLFTAGFLTTTSPTPTLSLPWVLVAAAGGALAGAQIGYVLGRKAGAALHARTHRPRVQAAMGHSRRLFERYGYGRAIVLARFVPVVRTVLNPVAGALGVPAGVFTLWQVVGGFVWTVGLVLVGHALGSTIPGIDRYLMPVVVGVVVLSLVPLGLEALRAHRTSARRPGCHRAPERGTRAKGGVSPAQH